MAWITALLACLTLYGCMKVGPDYERPEISVPPSWHTRLKEDVTNAEMEPQLLAVWWTTLNDPGLSRLIERAVAANLDLKKAAARVREARASRGVVRAGLFPTLDAKGTAGRSRSSEESGSGVSSDLYVIGFDAGWELDLFGGVRRYVEATEATLQSSREDWRNALVSLLAEVALNYVDARTYQARLSVAKSNIESQNETCQLTSWRYQAGLSDELAVQQARYNLENTRSQMPALRTGLEAATNRIAVLLGEQPGMVHGEMTKAARLPVTPPAVAVGVPADVLRRRPDVRKAERDLAAQTAKVGVAMADLYPKFKLSGSIGLEALSLGGNLFSSGSRTLSGGSKITWPIFDGGAIRQNIEVQSALQEQSLLAYETAVLTALEEVENALVAYREEQKRRTSLAEAARAAQRAAELAEDKFRAGLADFGTVLEAQRSHFSFQDQLAQSDGAVIANLVRLYKALGGGWTSLVPEEKG